MSIGSGIRSDFCIEPFEYFIHGKMGEVGRDFYMDMRAQRTPAVGEAGGAEEGEGGGADDSGEMRGARVVAD